MSQGFERYCFIAHVGAPLGDQFWVGTGSCQRQQYVGLPHREGRDIWQGAELQGVRTVRGNARRRRASRGGRWGRFLREGRRGGKEGTVEDGSWAGRSELGSGRSSSQDGIQ